MQIKEEHHAWRAASERVLHTFARSILADPRHFPELSDLIQQKGLAELIHIYEANPDARVEYEWTKNTVPSLFEFKKDTLFGVWLRNRLAKDYNYLCADDEQQMARALKAVTANGLIKHDQTHYEKDNRFSEWDDSVWVIGFDNKEKLETLSEKLTEVERRRDNLAIEVEKGTREEKDIEDKIHAAKSVSNAKWTEVDIAPLLTEINRIEQDIDKLKRKDQTVADIKRDIEKVKEEKKNVEEKIREEGKVIDAADNRIKAKDKTIEALMGELKEAPTQIRARFDDVADLHKKNGLAQVSVSYPDKIIRDMEKILDEDIGSQKSEKEHAEREMVFDMGEFLKNWPEESANALVADVKYADRFLERKRELETDQLHSFTKKFHQLFEQYTRKHLIEFVTGSDGINRERSRIVESVKQINAPLSENAFGNKLEEETYLRIDVKSNPPPEYSEFLEQFERIQSLGETHEKSAPQPDAITKEEDDLYNELNDLLTKLDPETENAKFKHWRERVLDVRQHYTFKGQEYRVNADGEQVDVDFYDGDDGKSGGEGSKLTQACLAAALYFQLGGALGRPVYTTVCLDEAFANASPQFTNNLLSIFNKFKFQLILVTPMRGFKDISKFIASATAVERRTVKINDKPTSISIIGNVTVDELKSRILERKRKAVQQAVAVKERTEAANA